MKIAYSLEFLYLFAISFVQYCSLLPAYQRKSNKLTCNNFNEIFHKFDDYGNVNCLLTSVLILFVRFFGNYF